MRAEVFEGARPDDNFVAQRGGVRFHVALAEHVRVSCALTEPREAHEALEVRDPTACLEELPARVEREEADELLVPARLVRAPEEAS